MAQAPLSYGDSPVPTFTPSPSLPQNPRLVQNTTLMKYGISSQAQTLNLNPNVNKPGNGNAVTQGLRLGVTGVKSLIGSIGAGILDVGQTVGLAAAGAANAAVNYSPLHFAVDAIQNTAKNQADAIYNQAMDNLKNGRIGTDEFNKEMDRYKELQKWSHFQQDLYVNTVNALVDKTPTGEVDYAKTAISVASGLVTLATLPIGGEGIATKGALTGLAKTGEVLAERQAPKLALGALATGNEVSTKAISSALTKATIEGMTKIQAQSAQRALLLYASTKAGVNTVLMGGKEVPAIYATTAKLFEKSMNAVPGFRYAFDNLVSRAGKGAYTQALARDVATELALRAPIRRANLQFATDTVDAYRQDKWFSNGDKMGAIPATILQASFLLEGGPIGAIVKGFGNVSKALKLATYDEKTFIDAVYDIATSQHFGFTGHATGSIYQAVDRLPEYMKADAFNLLKQVAYTQTKNSTIDRAAYTAFAHFVDAHPNMTEKDLALFWEDVLRWAYHSEKMRPVQTALLNAGKGAVVLAKYDKTTEKSLLERMTKAVYSAVDKLKKEEYKTTSKEVFAERLQKQKDAALKVIADAIDNNETWTMNEDVVQALTHAIQQSKSAKGITLSPRAFNAAKAVNTSKRALNKLIGKNAATEVKTALENAAKDGYYLVTTLNRNPKLLASAEQAKDFALKSTHTFVDDVVFEQASQAQPFFRTAGTILQKLGLSADESGAVAYRMVRDNASEGIAKATGRDVAGGRRILNKLQQSLELPDNNKLADLAQPIARANKRLTTDLRMMSKVEMKLALERAGEKLTDTQLKGIRKAIIDAHLSVPFQTMGLADKLIAASYKYNMFYKYYAKAQGAFRYTYNPFFNVQEVVESEILGQAAVNGKQVWLPGVGILNPHLKGQLDNTVRYMDEIGFFNGSVRVGNEIGDNLMATRFGEAAQDVYLGRVSAHITQTQKRSIAGVVQKIAESKNMTVQEALHTMGQEIEDIVRPIVQYPSKGILNTNLAKALNLAVFPTRYNLKVTGLAVKFLAKQSPAMQALTINKLWEMNNWLNTPAGIAWQQDNAQAIQLFKWITPIGNVQAVFNMLGAPFGEGYHNWGDIGVLGGLPFGVISQILQSQGIININAPYVNPSTGDIYSKKIPESMKARVASAFMDLLGSTFTYPGNTLGLPSKSGMLRAAASAISLDTKYNDWQTTKYTNADLPDYLKLRQQILAERYSLEHGIANKYDVAPSNGDLPNILQLPKGKMPAQRVDTGRTLTKSELYALKQQKSSSSSKSKKKKTTTFPSNLPQ